MLQTIPTYVMGISKLPTSFYDELRFIIIWFWWGSSRANRKIAWLKWNAICLPKTLGGLGFWDLQVLNQSLVAKLTWHVLKEPTSLASRILKGKYFNDYHFMQALQKRGSSYI